MKKIEKVGTIALCVAIAFAFLYLPRYASWGGFLIFLLVAALGILDLFSDKKEEGEFTSYCPDCGFQYSYKKNPGCPFCNYFLK